LLSLWLFFYLAPFALIFACWNRLSYAIMSGLILAGLAWAWIDHRQVLEGKRDIGFAFGDIFLLTMSVGAAAGFSARGLALAKGWRPASMHSLLAGLIALAATPAFFGAQMTYDQWQRRPPTADCASRTSFGVGMGEHRLSIPNWPLVMASSGDETFLLSIPAHLRRACQWSVPGSYGSADSATFFFDHVVSRPKPALKAWEERTCRAAEGVAASLVCGQRPIEQLSIYADRDFARRTISLGRASSHAFFQQQKKEGRYPESAARRYPSALAFPDGTWAFDDGSVFRCRQSANGYPVCTGDFEPAPGLLAKVQFNAWNGDIETAQRSAREAFERLYREVLSKPAE
jgi:hypothetical protein